MLPACRTADETFAIPQFALTRNDIDLFMDELREFHTAFRACFARQEPRDQFFHIPLNLVVERVTTHRKPPDVRICRLRNQSRVGTFPPSTSTPHCPACWARRW